MVEILCPHCEEEIELDDDAKGDLHVLIARENLNGEWMNWIRSWLRSIMA